MPLLESLDDTSTKAFAIGEQYYGKTLEYYKLKVFQQLVSTTGMLCKIAVVGGIVFLGITVMAVAGILALGELLGSMVFGCLIVAGVLLLCGLVAYKYRAKIDRLLIRKMSKDFFS